jgi:hypothetical protein
MLKVIFLDVLRKVVDLEGESFGMKREAECILSFQSSVEVQGPVAPTGRN